MKEKLKTLPKIHKACSNKEIRPVFSHILVTKNAIVSTNTKILVVHKTSDVFSEEFINEMPERFLVHKEVWKQFSKPHSFIFFDKDKNLISFIGKTFSCFFPIENEEKVGLFPEWEAVIHNAELEVSNGVKEIGINPFLLFDLKEAMNYTGEEGVVSLHFTDSRTAILVKSRESSCYGVIMPSLLF